MSFLFNGFNSSFSSFPGTGFKIVFFLVFGLIFALIIFVIVRGIGTWNKNNHSPRLTVDASVVTKRMDVSHHNSAGDAGGFSSSSSWYYVTFQVDSGDRMELMVPDSEFGMLVEGDKGKLTFQGTRFLEFKRMY